jgi:hypothetical protein
MNVLFPLSFEACDITPVDRVDSDTFESGGSALARRWPANYFRHQINLTTSKLTPDEWRYLRAFYGARGTSDYFWFRDNPGRTGNYKVRFAKPFPQTRSVITQAQIELQEAAPRRVLPEWDEIIGITSSLLVSWFDANRETYILNAGTATLDSALYDAAFGRYPAVRIGASNCFDGVFGQYQTYFLDGDAFCRSASNVSEFASSTHPFCTLFAFVRAATSGDDQVLFSVGANGTNTGMGLKLGADNYFRPWVGSAAFTNAKYLNSAADTWRSIAVRWDSANLTTLFVNGVQIGQDTVARNFTAGPLAIGAAPDQGSQAQSADLAQVMFFNMSLSLAQVKALHNLFCYQYGLATV